MTARLVGPEHKHNPGGTSRLGRAIRPCRPHQPAGQQEPPMNPSTALVLTVASLFAVAVLILVYSCLRISSACSRMEELGEHPTPEEIAQ